MDMNAEVDMSAIVGSHDIVFITLDTLRYDVAEAEMRAGNTPTLEGLLGGWEKRHTPGSFTFAAHQAFFAGFLPTPARPGRHPRLFAAAFAGSETTASGTAVFDTATIVEGLATVGYRTICIGGVGFFNRRTRLGSVLPDLFDQAVWDSSLGVTAPDSTENQVDEARRLVESTDGPVFLFLNVSALHQPNYFYLNPDDETRSDSLASHAAALRYVDRSLAPLLATFRARGPSFWIVCSDHGTAYGEDGFHGHRLAHETVMTVPYAHAVLEGN